SVHDFAGSVLPGGVLTFAAGETAATFTIRLAGDAENEGDETFDVSIKPLAGIGGTNSLTSTPKFTIVNDDLPSDSTFAFEADGNYRFSEGQIGSRSFTVRRYGSLDGTASVEWYVSSMGGDANTADFNFGS